MKRYLTFICQVLFLSIGFGQNTLTVKEFLAGAGEEEAVIFQNQKINFLNTNSHKLPLIEKLEFRTKTNDFDFWQQDYSLRVSPNSIRNMKTQRQYQKTVQFMTEMELDAAWSQALRNRYDLLINYILINEILAIKEKQKILYKDKVTLLKRSIALPDFDVLDLIAAEDESQENLHDILDLENAILTIEGSIQRMDDSTRFIYAERENLLSVEDIKNILEEIKPKGNAYHPELKVMSAKVQNSKLAYKWEAAKTRPTLGFVEIRYGFGNTFNFKKSISIGLGFDIPLKGAARLDLNELQINIFETESYYRNAKDMLINEKYSVYYELDNLIQKYQLVTYHLNESQAEFALREYSKIAEASPKAMLKLRENTLKKELFLQQLELQIFQHFIEYLDFAGMLSQKPYKNYLSKRLDEF